MRLMFCQTASKSISPIHLVIFYYNWSLSISLTESLIKQFMIDWLGAGLLSTLLIGQQSLNAVFHPVATQATSCF
jgi:hypothetical protein